MSIIKSHTIIGSGGQSTGYKIERSLRFNSADSAYLNRTPASAGNRRTWTWSGWIKKTKNVDDYPPLFNAGQSAPDVVLRFDGGGTYPDTLSATLENGGGVNAKLETTQVFRDVGGWYHIVWAIDTTQATANNRQRLYVNGVEVTAFNTRTNPSQNFDTQVNNTVEHRIGAQRYASYFNGYMTEINFIDGQQLTPSSFGETDTDTGVWKPKAYSGSYGTNGFYLKFADNSGTTSTTLGKDSSGNGNNWTPNNFSVTAGAGNDSLVDTPTPYGSDTGAGGEVRGNYCTVNPLDINAGSDVAVSNGNLYYVVSNVSAHGLRRSTMSVSSGKWYAECTIATATGGTDRIGILSATQAGLVTDTNPYVGKFSGGYAYKSNGSSASKENNNTSSSYGDSYTTNDVIGIALDMDAGTLTFYKNGVSQGQAYSGLTGEFCFAGSPFNGGAHFWNFGQRPFAYTAPSGFKALCTQNLPTPTIGATSSTQANDYFNVVLYTGNDSNRSITGVGFQPDWVWIKNRSTTSQHVLTDAVRGVTKQLFSSLTNAEQTSSTGITSFDADGFSLGTNVGPTGSTNSSPDTYVAWNWKANGAGSSNTAGSITSTVSANPTAGFSIVTYSSSGNIAATVGHGLGVAPQMIIAKFRDIPSNWSVYHVGVGNTARLKLNTTDALETDATLWNNTTPGSSVFTVGSSFNQPTAYSYVFYCFAPVAGYSAFGSYTGNGSTDGVFIYTGFRPRYILVKPSSTTGSWLIHDAVRDPYNVSNLELQADTSLAEYNTNSVGAGDRFDLLSNGFKNRSSNNGANSSGTTYVYAAFAEVPTKFALAR